MQKIQGLLLGIACCLSSLVWAQSSPVPMLQATADRIINTLNNNKADLKKHPQVIYQAVEHYLLPQVDVSGMSRSVLGRQAWMHATAAERTEFTQAFTQLVVRTYASPLAQYTDETIKFLPVRGSLDGRFLKVSSIIVRSKGNNIPLSYSLVSSNGQWKIYDLSVEGVSLLQSFRSQFAQALQNSSMKELIQRMRERSKKAA